MSIKVLNFVNPNSLIVSTKSIKPLKVLANASPAASYGTISASENIMLTPSEYIEIFAAVNCCSCAYNQSENIFANPKGRRPIKYIVKIRDVLDASEDVNAPLSKSKVIINSLV